MGPGWEVPKVRMKSLRGRGGESDAEPMGCEVPDKESSKSGGEMAASRALWSWGLQPGGRGAGSAAARRALAEGREAMRSSELAAVMDQVFSTVLVREGWFGVLVIMR